MAISLKDLQLIYGVAGAREKFEQLCSLLIKSEYPTAHSIRIMKGDGGVDTAEGDWKEGSQVTVFQQKYFIERIGDSQKQQIRQSFMTARDNPAFSLKKWILCIPINLSTEEKAWWDEWRSNQKVDIELWDQLRLEHLLLDDKNKGIKESFFKQEYLGQIREMHQMLIELLEQYKPIAQLEVEVKLVGYVIETSKHPPLFATQELHESTFDDWRMDAKLLLVQICNTGSKTCYLDRVSFKFQDANEVEPTFKGTLQSLNDFWLNQYNYKFGDPIQPGQAVKYCYKLRSLLDVFKREGCKIFPAEASVTDQLGQHYLVEIPEPVQKYLNGLLAQSH